MTDTPPHAYDKARQCCTCGWKADPMHVRLEHWETQWRNHLNNAKLEEIQPAPELLREELEGELSHVRECNKMIQDDNDRLRAELEQAHCRIGDLVKEAASWATRAGTAEAALERERKNTTNAVFVAQKNAELAEQAEAELAAAQEREREANVTKKEAINGK